MWRGPESGCVKVRAMYRELCGLFGTDNGKDRIQLNCLRGRRNKCFFSVDF